LGLDVIQPERLHDPEALDRIASISPEVACVCAYGVLIKEPLLSYEILNVHPSLLPRWRGAAPVERAIMAGDAETGVTIHETVKALDAGPIAARRAFPIEAEDDAGAVYARAGALAAELLADVLPSPRFEPQPEDGVTYAEKIGPEDRQLDPADPEQAVRTVRALSPHIGARAELHGRGVTVWRAHVEDGTFVPDEVQPDGRTRMRYDEFLRGLR
jgi:methionyl-tRNA formyltransferase